MPRWSFVYRSTLVVLATTILVGCPPTAPDSEPVANFSGSPRSGNTGLLVSFADDSTTAMNGEVLSWQWNFGDGGRSTEPNPVHQYLTAGEFTVSLTVTSSGGSNTRTRTGYIRVDSPSGSDRLDSDGGTVSSNGVSISVPEGALSSRVDFGITRVATEIPFNVFETINRVGDTFQITHDSDSGLSGSSDDSPLQPATLAIPYAEDVVPTGSRTSANVHIIAQLATGEVIPIMGRIGAGVVEAEVLDLPEDALYAVVYRPDAYLATATATTKSPTSFDWNDSWQLSLSPALLTQLTALRLGDVGSSSSFFVRDFSSEQTEATEQALLDGLLAATASFDSVQARSPRLLTMNSAYTAICFNLVSDYPNTFSSLDGVFYVGNPFGSIVLDPQQLLAISTWNADRLAADSDNVDIAQILSADQAVAEGLARAVTAGYEIPAIAATSPSDGADVDFSAGIQEGLALYAGQMNSGLNVNRSQNAGDIALLSTPVLAPFDLSVPGYSAASQDFFRYVANRYSPTPPLAYIASGTGSVKGLLEEVRLSLAGANLPSFSEAALLASTAIDGAFFEYLEVSLGGAYYNFALDLAFEHGPDGNLRASDGDRIPLVLDQGRFSADAILTGTLSGPDAGIDFPGAGDLGLTAIPPLATRVVIVNADPSAATLNLTFNRDEWTADTRGQSVEVVVYREGLSGVPLPDGESTLSFSDFEADLGDTSAVFYVLVVNTSVTTPSSVEVVVQSTSTE
jgi:PKD repeat protein